MFTRFKTALAVGATLSALSVPVHAATYQTDKTIGSWTDLIGSTTTTVKEDGKIFEVTENKYRTTTQTERTTHTSRTKTVYNHRDYDFRVRAGWANSQDKWYNFNNISQDSGKYEGARRLSWGKALTGDGQSSFTFTTDRGHNVDTGNRVKLGQFLHDNNVIKGGLTDTELHLGIDLFVDGGRRSFDWAFDINHVESWNWFSDVADEVTISDERFMRDFRVAGVDYRFSLLGFFEGAYYDQNWKTGEGHETRRDLLAMLTSKEQKLYWTQSKTTFNTVDHFSETMRTQIAAVPLPASALLLLGGVGAIGAVRRRKKAA